MQNELQPATYPIGQLTAWKPGTCMGPWSMLYEYFEVAKKQTKTKQRNVPYLLHHTTFRALSQLKNIRVGCLFMIIIVIAVVLSTMLHKI